MPIVPTRLATPLLVLGLWACGADAPDGAQSGTTAELGPVDGHQLAAVDLDRVQVGDTAPDFALESYDDGVVALSDFRGEKDVVLVFFRGHW